MIRVIDRYLLSRFIISLVVAIGTITLIALIVDLIENLEKIVDNAASASDVFVYYLYFIPWIYKVTIPAAVLLAGMFSIGMLAKNFEIVAMKAAGISIYRIALPLLLFTFFLSIGNFYFNEYILPHATSERLRIKHGEIEKNRARKSSIMYNVSRQGANGYIYHFGTFKPERQEAKSVLIQKFVKDTLVESYRSEKIIFNSGYWTMYDGTYRNFTEGLEQYIKFDTLLLKNCRKAPEEFVKFRGKPEDMGYEELAAYVDMQRRSARPYVRELVDLQIKLSFPFTSFIVMFISIPIASNPKRSGVAMSFALASGISLLYFVIFKVTQSLGYSGQISPEVAAWSINGIFLLIGLIVFWRSHK